MSNSRHLTVAERANIYLRNGGVNISEISLKLNIRRKIVRLWVNHDENEGNLETKQCCGAPPIITQEHRAMMVAIATYEQEPFTSTREFANLFDYSMLTLRKHLRRAGILHRKLAVKIHLSEAHNAARVRLAQDYYDFSDEKCFKSSQIGQKRLRRVNNNRYEPKNIVPNLVVNMWAWMSAAVPGEIVYIPGHYVWSNYSNSYINHKIFNLRDKEIVAGIVQLETFWCACGRRLYDHYPPDECVICEN